MIDSSPPSSVFVLGQQQRRHHCQQAQALSLSLCRDSICCCWQDGRDDNSGGDVALTILNPVGVCLVCAMTAASSAMVYDGGYGRTPLEAHFVQSIDAVGCHAGLFLALEIGIFETLIGPSWLSGSLMYGYFTMIILLANSCNFQHDVPLCPLWIPQRDDNNIRNRWGNAKAITSKTKDSNPAKPMIRTSKPSASRRATDPH
jgi:hypothetical protein